jgi:1-acyl-sn-glycerol-3-phosphate acyltransferase
MSELTRPPAALRYARGPVWRALGRIYLKAGGWKVEGAFPEDPRCVIIVAPHTSNWDFTLGIAVVLALELRASWLGKHTIFKRPFRGLLRWLGGIPVDRGKGQGVVGACVAAFREAPALYVALAPEGTRKAVTQWKTGFYLIATKAAVPILPVSLDYRSHVVRFMPAFHPTGDLERDLPLLQGLFAEVEGRRPSPPGQSTLRGA